MANVISRRSFEGVIFLALFGALTLCAPAYAATRYVVGVVPQMPPVTMYANWKPFLEQLSRETGLDFKLKVYDKMSDFEADIDGERPDIIFPNPIQAAHAARNHRYIPVVRSSKLIEGVLFVKKDSPIQAVEELKDRDVAFVGSRNV